MLSSAEETSAARSRSKTTTGPLTTLLWRRLGGGVSQWRSALKGAEATAAVTIGTLVLGTITGVLVARGLGPAARGELVIASAGPLLIGSLLILGLDEALVYRLAQSSTAADRGRVVGSALATGVALGLLATIVALVLQWQYFRPLSKLVDERTLLVYGTLPLIFVYSQVVLATMRAREQYRLWNVCRATVPVTYLVLLLGLGADHYLSAASVLIAHYAANLGLALYLVGRLRLEERLSVELSSSAQLLSLGLKHHLISVGQFVNQRVDQVILARVVSAEQLGLYAVAVTYSSLALSVALAPAWHLFSRASRDGSIDATEFRLVQRSTTAGVALLAVVNVVCAPIIIPAVFGRTFAAAVTPAAILLLGGPALALSALRAAAWKASGRPVPAALAEGAGIVVTVVGLTVFSQKFGIIAAACTSVVAYGTVAAVLLRIGPAPTVRRNLRSINPLGTPDQ